MTIHQQNLLNRALSSLYKVEMLQKMAKASDGVLDEYPVCEYAYILDGVLQELAKAITDLDDDLAQQMQ